MQCFNDYELKTYGPNCWSAALLTTAMINSPRPVSKPEFWFWLNSDYCRAVSPDEVPKRGDIGSLFSINEGNTHSFVYLDANTAFEKRDPYPRSAYKTNSRDNSINPREMDASCKERQLDIFVKNDCIKTVVYHRCSPIPLDFYSRHAELTDVAVLVQNLEEGLTEYIRIEHEQTTLRDAFVKLDEYLTKVEKLKFSGDQEFARQALRWKIIGLLLINLSDETRSLPGVLRAEKINRNERTHIPKLPQDVVR